ncbi:MAG: pilin [Candidatus Berkelbacteria bacterium]
MKLRNLFKAKKYWLYSLIIIVFLIILFFVLGNPFSSADELNNMVSSKSCFPGAYYLKNTSRGNFTGIEATVVLGSVKPDDNRFQTVTYSSNNYCKSKDNPDIYFGIKDVNGQESDVGLEWELGKDENGNTSQTQIVFRPYWRTEASGLNMAPISPAFQWHSGETVTMTLTVPKDNSLIFKVSGSGKSFETEPFAAKIRKNTNHEVKFVTSIDQLGRENLPVEGTNTVFSGTQWLSRKVFIGESGQSINIPKITSEYRQACPSGKNILLSITNRDLGAEVVSMQGNTPNNIDSGVNSCKPHSDSSTSPDKTVSSPTQTKVVDPVIPSSGRDIIITTPSEIKLGQKSPIKINFKKLKGYTYYLWVSSKSSKCANPENGQCFYQKSHGLLTGEDQTVDYVWNTSASGTGAGDHLIRVKVFNENESNDQTDYCKQEGTVSASTRNPVNPSNITTIGINCSNSSGAVNSSVNNYDVTIDIGQFYDLYAPANFIIYRDGKQVGETASRTFIDRNVPEGEHEYEVRVLIEENQKESFLNIFSKVYAQGAAPSRKINVTVGAPVTQSNTTGNIDTDFGRVNNIGDYISKFFVWGLPILSGLAIAIFMYAGYLYMTSQGNQENITTAKDLMMGVVLGLLLLYTAQALLTNVIGIR